MTQEEKREALKQEAETVMSTLPASQSKLANVVQEKGSSNWLTALPMEGLGFALNKGQFKDAICLRYW